MKKALIIAMMFAGIPAAHAGGVVHAPADKVYHAAMEVALDIGAMPTISNDSMMYFKTNAVTIKPTEKQCDCGSMFGIPYVKDKRTMADVAYMVRVKSEGSDQAEVDVTTSISGYYDESRNSISNFMADKHRSHDKTLDCKSTGAIEAAFIDKVRQKLGVK